MLINLESRVINSDIEIEMQKGLEIRDSRFEIEISFEHYSQIYYKLFSDLLTDFYGA